MTTCSISATSTQSFNPLPVGTDPPFWEFKMMPVYLHLKIDQRKIPELLVECANSTMPVEIKKVRINPGSGGSALGGMEGGTAASGAPGMEGMGGRGMEGMGGPGGHGRTGAGMGGPGAGMGGPGMGMGGPGAGMGGPGMGMGGPGMGDGWARHGDGRTWHGNGWAWHGNGGRVWEWDRTRVLQAWVHRAWEWVPQAWNRA